MSVFPTSKKMSQKTQLFFVNTKTRIFTRIVLFSGRVFNTSVFFYISLAIIFVGFGDKALHGPNSQSR